MPIDALVDPIPASIVNSPINEDRVFYSKQIHRRRSSLLNINNPTLPMDSYRKFLRRGDVSKASHTIADYELQDEFTEQAFMLPEEELIDKRAYERERYNRIVEIKRLKEKQREDRYMNILTSLDRRPRHPHILSKQ